MRGVRGRCREVDEIVRASRAMFTMQVHASRSVLCRGSAGAAVAEFAARSCAGAHIDGADIPPPLEVRRLLQGCRTSKMYQPNFWFTRLLKQGDKFLKMLDLSSRWPCEFLPLARRRLSPCRRLQLFPAAISTAVDCPP